MLEVWILWRYLSNRSGSFFNFVSVLSILGLALGVGTLVLVMAVVAGFERTLREAVVDVTGHILLIKRGEPLENLETLEPRLRKIVPEITSISPFVHVEGMVFNGGKLSGVVMEGFDPTLEERTQSLKPRLVKGVFDLSVGRDQIPRVMLGKALAEKLDIHVGDEINIVLPKNQPSTRVVGFVTRLRKFKVSGILDLGKYDFDSRYVIASAKAAQELAGVGPFFTGARLRLTNHDLAREAGFKLATQLGFAYLVRDWFEANYNFFQAIKIERVVIFVVMLFMVVAACFNVSSTLFVAVLRRYGDISILKILGARRRSLMKLFAFQGLMVGMMGTILGLVLGLVICQVVAHTNFIYVPPEIYKIGRLPVDVRMIDVGAVVISALLLSLLSAWAPARRGASLDPVEGLKYD